MAKKNRPTAEDKAFYEQAAQEYYDALARAPVPESALAAELRAERAARETAEAEIAALRAELDQLKKSK